MATTEERLASIEISLSSLSVQMNMLSASLGRIPELVERLVRLEENSKSEYHDHKRIFERMDRIDSDITSLKEHGCNQEIRTEHSSRIEHLEEILPEVGSMRSEMKKLSEGVGDMAISLKSLKEDLGPIINLKRQTSRILWSLFGMFVIGTVVFGLFMLVSHYWEFVNRFIPGKSGVPK